jgi:hypothetical protein
MTTHTGVKYRYVLSFKDEQAQVPHKVEAYVSLDKKYVLTRCPSGASWIETTENLRTIVSPLHRGAYKRSYVEAYEKVLRKYFG